MKFKKNIGREENRHCKPGYRHCRIGPKPGISQRARCSASFVPATPGKKVILKYLSGINLSLVSTRSEPVMKRSFLNMLGVVISLRVMAVQTINDTSENVPQLRSQEFHRRQKSRSSFDVMNPVTHITELRSPAGNCHPYHDRSSGDRDRSRRARVFR